MARCKGTTRIHELELDGEILSLLEDGRGTAEIRRLVRLRFGIELSPDDVDYFRKTYGAEIAAAGRRGLAERQAGNLRTAGLLAESEWILAVQRDRLKRLSDAEWHDLPDGTKGFIYHDAVDNVLALFNRLLTDHIERLDRAGLLHLKPEIPEGSTFIGTQINTGDRWELLAADLKAIGVVDKDVADLVMRRQFGWDRLGPRGPIRFRAPALAHQGAALELPGSCVSEGTVPGGSGEDRGEEGHADSGDGVAHS